MKKLLIIPIASILILSLNSCQKDPADFQDKHPVGQTYDYEGGAIYATHIDNGMDCGGCVNNIVVFPDWETFRATSDLLETQWDQHVTAFGEGIDSTMTDLEIEAYADSIGYHQEQPYLDFEAYYQFASLRKMIYDQETAWLATIDNFDELVAKANMDPSNHYIWYENRVLLNEQAEVIVKDSVGNNVIYKFYEGGYVTITGDNYGILQEFNQFYPIDMGPNDPPPSSDPPVGPPVTFHPYMPSGCICEPEPGDPPGSPPFDNPWSDFPAFTQICDICNNGNTGDGPTPCNGDGDHRQFFTVNGQHVMKTIDKFRGDGWLFGNRKVKAKTKFYRGDIGDFHRTTTTLTAKLEANMGISCGSGYKPLPKSKTRIASKVWVKWRSNDLIYTDPKLIEENVYGTHEADDPYSSNIIIKKIDVFDGSVQ